MMKNKNIKKKEKWELMRGVITPGGDPAYICPKCHSKDSIHINGIETRIILNKCPVCGIELEY